MARLGLVGVLSSLAACGNVERHRPPFYETNARIKARVEGLPEDGLALYEEPDGAGSILSRYFVDRALDFTDILGFSLLAGYGATVNVRATKAVQVGAGWHRAGRVGFLGRHGGVWWESRWEGGISLGYAHGYEVEAGTGTIQDHPDYEAWTARAQARREGRGGELGWIDWVGQNDRDFFDVGATAFAGVLGVDVAIRLKDLADFFLGWTTVDLKKDDALAREQARMVDLSRYMAAYRAKEFEGFLASLPDFDRAAYLEHPDPAVQLEVVRSIRFLEATRPEYCSGFYARFLDEERGDLQTSAVEGLERLSGIDSGFDPDRRRENNELAIKRLREWLRANPPAPGPVSPGNP